MKKLRNTASPLLEAQPKPNEFHQDLGAVEEKEKNQVEPAPDVSEPDKRPRRRRIDTFRI